MTTIQTLEHPPSSTGRAQPSRLRWLPLGAVAGPVLFSAGWVILGAVSPGYTVAGTWISPYSAVTQPISGLGLGVTGPYMNSVFILSGVLLLAGVIGVILALPPGGRRVTRIASSILLALSPVGLVIIGLFTLDSPAMHLLGAMLILATPVISFLITGLHMRGLTGWHRFGNGLLVAAPLTLVLFVLYTGSFDQSAVAAGRGVAGLTQRLLFVDILTWFAAMGWLAYRRTTSSMQASRKH